VLIPQCSVKDKGSSVTAGPRVLHTLTSESSCHVRRSSLQGIYPWACYRCLIL
jgi:hypothetical protein